MRFEHKDIEYIYHRHEKYICCFVIVECDRKERDKARVAFIWDCYESATTEVFQFKCVNSGYLPECHEKTDSNRKIS